jgi:hypothetical protein
VAMMNTTRDSRLVDAEQDGICFCEARRRDGQKKLDSIILQHEFIKLYSVTLSNYIRIISESNRHDHVHKRPPMQFIFFMTVTSKSSFRWI